MVAYIQSKIRSRQFTRDSLCGELEGEEKKKKGKNGREKREGNAKKLYFSVTFIWRYGTLIGDIVD